MLTEALLTSLPETTPAVLEQLGVRRTVYGFVYPETRALVDSLWAERPHALYAEPYRDRQDALHLPFLEAWERWSAPALRLDRAALPCAYATHGSTEAIRETLALHALARYAAGSVPRIHVFAGEYEGYAAQAAGYGIEVVQHDRGSYAESLRRQARAGDRMYLSEPSAIDGNHWDGFGPFLRFLAAELPEVELMLDLCYVGCVAREYCLDLRSPNLGAVFFSLSKAFGVYYHRIGGVLSRAPLPGLEGNRWFKNVFSLALGTLLLGRFGVRELPGHYRERQRRAVERVAERTGLPLAPSDALLLAHHPLRPEHPEAAQLLARGRAGDRVARYCLTPLLEELA